MPATRVYSRVNLTPPRAMRGTQQSTLGVGIQMPQCRPTATLTLGREPGMKTARLVNAGKGWSRTLTTIRCLAAGADRRPAVDGPAIPALSAPFIACDSSVGWGVVLIGQELAPRVRSGTHERCLRSQHHTSHLENVAAPGGGGGTDLERGESRAWNLHRGERVAKRSRGMLTESDGTGREAAAATAAALPTDRLRRWAGRAKCRASDTIGSIA